MSGWGLLVRDAQGNSNLNPDSFTVRLVETVFVYVGAINSTTVIDIPTSTNVLAGMFATITVHENSYYVTGYPNWQTYVSASIFAEIVPYVVPIVEVYNGFVRVKGQPIQESWAAGYVAISIMSYV